MKPAQNHAVNLATVLRDEDREIQALCANRRAITDVGKPIDGKPGRLGVAFSGGGIRSASVNLGLIQALAQTRLLGSAKFPGCEEGMKGSATSQDDDDLLRHVHYLSGISGGGYILGWLAAWIRRNGYDKVHALLASNRAACESSPPASPETYHRFLEPHPLRNLRQYASFITPRMGVFSGDTLALIAIYLRNLLLNQVLMVAAVAAVIALVQMAAPSILWAGKLPGCVLFLLIGLAFAAAITGGVSIGRCLGCLARDQDPKERKWLSVTARSAGAITALLVWLIIPNVLSRYRCWHLLVGAALLLASACLVCLAVAARIERREPIPDDLLKPVKPDKFGRFGILSGVIAGAFFLLLIYGFAKWVEAPDTKTAASVNTAYAALGWPCLLIAIALTTFVHIGIYGNSFPDAKREWLGRLAGYFFYFAVLAALVLVIALWGPLLMHLLFGIGATFGRDWLKWVLPGGWLFTTIAGLLAAKSPATGVPGQKSKLEILVKIAPPVFLIGVLLLVSWAVHSVAVYPWEKSTEYLDWGSWQAGPDTSLPANCQNSKAPCVYTAHIDQCVADYDHQTGNAHVECNPKSGPIKSSRALWALCVVFVVCGVVAGVLLWRLDVNEFSMHLFYRNRLVRAFLGASKIPRKPSPFTGFNLKDDIALHDLCFHSRQGWETQPPAPAEDASSPQGPTSTSAQVQRGPTAKDVRYNGPYPIWGTALNLTSGEVDLAWQQRKAASFIYSPLYCGWDYVTTEPRADEKPDSDGECRELAPSGEESKHRLCKYAYRVTGKQNQSGAAVASAYTGQGEGPYVGNAMAASGAAVSPNWGYHTSPMVAALLALFNVRIGWWTGNPRNDPGWHKYAPGPYYLAYEVLGSIGDDDKFVYLSDGGHFENLGVYELVRRRMKYIIACDADADPDYGFEDLGNAIDKCRRDFGVEIVMKDIHCIRPRKSDQKPEAAAAAGNTNGKNTGTQPENPRDICGNAGFSPRHWAVGEIRYPAVANKPQAKGVLLYLKSSLTGDEPADVLSQHLSNAAFPHDTTLNQFFNETQFEVYRALGQHMFKMIWEEFKKAQKKDKSPAPKENSSSATPPPEKQIKDEIGKFFTFLNNNYGPASETEAQPAPAS